jgi:hypothetical protein
VEVVDEDVDARWVGIALVHVLNDAGWTNTSFASLVGFVPILVQLWVSGGVFGFCARVR